MKKAILLFTSLFIFSCSSHNDEMVETSGTPDDIPAEFQLSPDPCFPFQKEYESCYFSEEDIFCMKGEEIEKVPWECAPLNVDIFKKPTIHE